MVNNQYAAFAADHPDARAALEKRVGWNFGNGELYYEPFFSYLVASGSQHV